LKKKSFVQGAIIATLGIVITKILGILYVIPFYAIIGDQGGALYGYAYTIYTFFLTLSSGGIPLAMSKLISEYNALGYHYTKERAFKIGRKVMLIVGIIVFIVLMIFAKDIANIIIGDIEGGNTIEDVTFVIRIIATAILIVPTLSVTKGYLQGHKFIEPSSKSQIIEQVVRVSIIIVGSYLTYNVFKLGLRTSVGVAVFGATLGACAALIYVVRVINKNKENFKQNELVTREEKDVTTKHILKKLVLYAVPFIMIDLAKSTYDFVNMLTVNNVMVKMLSYTIQESELVMSVLNTWGTKLNMIVISVATGICVSLIPNITSSYIKKDYKEVNNKVNLALQLLLVVALPMVIGLSLLAKPVWMLFYGNQNLGSVVYSYQVFTALFTCIFSITITIIQSLNKYKQVLISLICGVLTKIIFQIPLMISFKEMGLHAFYGIVTATNLGYLVSIIINLINLKKKVMVNYGDISKKIPKIILATFVMAFVVMFGQIIFKVEITSRLVALIQVGIYSLVGVLVYFLLAYKLNILEGLMNYDKLKSVLKRFRLKRN